MNLTELRILLVSFLKQLPKEDMNLLLSYLPVFLEDIQRDPSYLEKVPIQNTPSLTSISKTDENNSQQALISSLIENNAQVDRDNLTDDNMFDFDSYDEDSDETNQTNQSPHSQQIEMNQLISGRSVYTDTVLEYLLKMYQDTKYPTPEQFNIMSQDTKLTIKQLTTWFANTRFKLGDSKSQPKKKRKSLQKVNIVQNTSNSNAFASDTAINLNESKSNLDKTNDTTPSKIQSNSYDDDDTHEDADKDTNEDEENENENENDETYDDSSFLNFPGAKSLPRQTLDYLMNVYKTNKYPNADDIYKMSLETNLTCKKIKSWFDTSRFKLKHSKKKNQLVRHAPLLWK